MLALTSALVLLLAPAQYDASFSCDCRSLSAQTSGILGADDSGGQISVDYPKAGGPHLATALRNASRIVDASPGLALSSTWQTSVDVLIEGQIIAVPTDVAVTRVAGDRVTIAARGHSDATVSLQIGNLPASIDVNLVEVVKDGTASGAPVILASIADVIVVHFAARGANAPWDATYKLTLVAK